MEAFTDDTDTPGISGDTSGERYQPGVMLGPPWQMRGITAFFIIFKREAIAGKGGRGYILACFYVLRAPCPCQTEMTDKLLEDSGKPWGGSAREELFFVIEARCFFR